jgi:hypothetical protein
MLLAAALVLAVLAFVLGAAWDIQWHYAIGRDRPFIPPHLLLLGGIALTGTLALAGVHTDSAVLATLGFRLVSFWLPLPAGLVAAWIFRRRFPRVTLRA